MWSTLLLPLLSGPPWSGLVVSFRVSSMGQIELPNHLLRIIIFSILKPYSCVQIIHNTLKYLIDRITNVKLPYSKPFNSMQINELLWQCPPPATPYLSTSLKQYYSWPVIHLVGPPGYFTFLYGHKRNTTETMGEKKNKRTIWAYISSKRKKGSFVTLHSSWTCRLTLACILRETSTKCSNNADIFSRWLARPLCSSSGFSSRLSDFCCSDILWAVHSKPTALLSRPLSTASLRFPSPTALLWVPFPAAPLASLGPAFPPPLTVSSEISSSGLCLVSQQNRQRDRLLGAHTP